MTKDKMDTGTRFVKNTLSLLSSQVVIKVLSFVLIIFVARYLGATDYGKYNFALTFISFFAPVAGLGLSQLMIREVAKKKEDREIYLGTTLLLKLVASVVMFGVAFGITSFVPLPVDTKIIIYLFGLAMIIENISAPYSCIYGAFERLDIRAVIFIVERIVSFALILSLLFTGYRLIAISTVRPITALLILGINILICNKIFIKNRVKFTPQLSKFLLKESWPFMVGFLFVTMYLKIDIIMLQAMKGASFVGLYSIAAMFVFVFMPIPGSFISSIYPVFSRTFSNKKEEFSLYFEKVAKILLTIAIPLSVIITICAYKIIPILYGKEYLSSIRVLQIIIWTLPFIFLSSLSRSALQSANFQRIAMWIAGGNIAVNIMLNYFLIPKFGMEGAAFATIITEIVGLILLFYFIKKRIGIELIKIIGLVSKSDLLFLRKEIFKR